MIFFVLCFFACSSETIHADSSSPINTIIDTNHFVFDVFVHSNQEPIVGAVVQQPGTQQKWMTDEEGKVQVVLDDDIVGELAISAWAEGYHIRGDEVPLHGQTSFEIELEPAFLIQSFLIFLSSLY